MLSVLSALGSPLPCLTLSCDAPAKHLDSLLIELLWHDQLRGAATRMNPWGLVGQELRCLA